MSERYGDCKLCGGCGKILNPLFQVMDECPQCGGTGFSGDADDKKE